MSGLVFGRIMEEPTIPLVFIPTERANRLAAIHIAIATAATSSVRKNGSCAGLARSAPKR